MNIENMMSALTPDIIAKFKTAIETGRWPDGRSLSPAQRETCMQAVIAYEHRHLPPEQRTGYVPPKVTACDHSGEHVHDNQSHDDSQALKWQ